MKPKVEEDDWTNVAPKRMPKRMSPKTTKMSKQKWKPYAEKLRDPRWQKKRLEVMERDGFACQNCDDKESTLNVHHWYYLAGNDPWDYPDGALVTLCESCHETIEDLKVRFAAVATGCDYRKPSGMLEEAIGLMLGMRCASDDCQVLLRSVHEWWGFSRFFRRGHEVVTALESGSLNAKWHEMLMSGEGSFVTFEDFSSLRDSIAENKDQGDDPSDEGQFYAGWWL